MFSENSRKIITAAAFILIFMNACRFWQKPETAAPPAPPGVVENANGGVPFQIEEPKTYQTEIINRIYENGEKRETKSFTAQRGVQRLSVFNIGEKNETALLEIGRGQTFSINRAKKIYAENPLPANVSSSAGDDFLTTEWLNTKTFTTFEKLEAENNLTKFRARLNESENSEVIIYFDENLKIPVRQEIYTISREQKILMFSTELSNFKTEADDKNFQLPKDFRKVSAKEFEEILWREKIAQ